MNAMIDAAATIEHKKESKRMRSRIEAAVQQHIKGNIQQAQKAYSDLIKNGCTQGLVFTNLALILINQQQHDAAISLLREGIKLDPDYVDAHLKLGCALEVHGNDALDEAIACYHQVQQRQPDHQEVNFVLGNALMKKGDIDGAIHCFQEAIDRDYQNKDVAHFNLGNLLTTQNRFDQASHHFKAATEIQPSMVGALSKYCHMQMKMCDWRDYEEMRSEIDQAITQLNINEKLDVTSAISPFSIINIVDDPQFFLKTARIYNTVTTSETQDISGLVAHVEAKKLEDPSNEGAPIKIAFLSADLYNHATAYLMGELFELMDSERFSIHVFSFGTSDPKSFMRQRIQQAIKYFHDVTDKNDTEIATIIAALGIDIAIDLKGYTAQCRPGILAHHPAPIQVNYLGYPGTMGADHIDYIIADHFIIPDDHQPFYSEKIAYMPDTYQVNDSHRVVHEHRPSRSECGLPEDAFVFCCFNQSYKITPDIFHIWMDILNKTPNSVLWLFESNEWATENLYKEAEKRGINVERIIFAPHQSVDMHLSRAQNADLFLDNFPCNAHTTASDALWIGLPLITISGNSFASRVAGSLLQAMGMDELITDNIESYQNLALKLANDPNYYQKVRNKLIGNRKNSALFNTKQYVENFQQLLIIMQENKRKSLPPEHIILPRKQAKTSQTEKSTMENTAQIEDVAISDHAQAALNVNVTIIRPAYSRKTSSFDEIAKLLQHAFTDLGFNAQLTVNTMIDDGINIILGAHLLKEEDLQHIPETSILYNLERIVDSTFIMQPALLEIFKRFPVWDNSQKNIQTLQKKGIEAIHVPIGYHTCLSDIENQKQQDIDVLFYGYVNARHSTILDALVNKGLNVESIHELQEQERNDHIARSKVVLNMHVDDNNHFELIDLPYLLGNRKAVISEYTENSELNDDYQLAIKAVSYDHILETCLDLVESDTARVQMEKQGFKIIQQHLATAHLNKAFSDLTEKNQKTEEDDNDQTINSLNSEFSNKTTRERQDISTLPTTLNIGNGKHYDPAYLNVDIDKHCKTDAIVDLADHDLIGRTVISSQYGVINFSNNQFEKIIANNILEQITDLSSAMTNSLNLLQVGGELHISVPYDLSYGAWQNPATVRAFNERSWLYYTDWFESMKWTEARFDLTNLDFRLSPLGVKMQQDGISSDRILPQARAVDSMQVILTKRLLTEKEKLISLTGIAP
jgi:predicted O-linked N-acetylglucosamine transferase (SPINDLY family)/FKBP-type peptidyl-prolyl cis-trans isomerase